MAPLSRLTGVGFAMCAMISAQLGAVISVPLMVSEGSFRITALRISCATAISVAWVRPNFRSYNRHQWKGAIALGIAMSLMIMCFFTSMSLIPAGAAAAIMFLGPVGVAVYSMKGWSRVALPGLAAFGVMAISLDSHGWLFSPIGALFALGGAAGWAAYIVFMRDIGRLFSAQDGLCLSLGIATIIALPVSYVLEPTGEWLAHLPAIAGLALLAPLIPFALEMMALRRIEMGTFSILMSLEPAVGTLLGLAILQQYLTLQQIAGVLAVMGASAGAVLLSPKASQQTPASEGAASTGRAHVGD
jgi:inner membrane transporter RhtA